MAVLYLVLFVGWLLVVGLTRAAILRRTPAEVIHFADPPGSPQWWSRRVATLGTLLALATPLADLAGLDPIGVLDHGALAALGVVLVVAGTALTLAGQAAMGSSWRADVDLQVRTELVVDGPFRWVRNPIIAGMAVTALGLALIVPNLVAVAMLALFAVSWEVQIRLVEEPYLAHTHGDTYRAYARRTGRFLPAIGRLRSP
jgi:protein-S-isoprenylcysteine O-methyltransferase Ste14